MARPVAVVAAILVAPLLTGAAVLAIADNEGGGFPGAVEFGSNRGVSPGDRTTEEFLTATASCGPLPAGDHFAPIAGDDEPDLELVPVADIELAAVMTFLPDGSALVGRQTGQVVHLVDGEPADLPVIDLSADTATKDDQGLLGLAVDPEGAWLYLHHTDALGDSIVRAYPIRNGLPDPYGEETILRVDQPTRQHNGGALAFGPDGYLYVTFGDGGGLGDPYRNAQDPATVLGSVVRFQPLPGSIPPAAPAIDNPFVGGPRDSAWSWAYGTRNPFRFSFDPETGDLWLPDIGQQCVEEINVLTPDDAGANLGWNVIEGDRPFLGTAEDLPDRLDPVFTYRHDVGLCAIVGGVVYRGAAIPELQGRYVFTDYCNGQLVALDPATGDVVRWPETRVERAVSITADPDGELWVTSLEDGVFRLVAG